jgi:hypothetical protein
MVFDEPVVLFIQLPGETNLGQYRIYHYDPNPAVGWQEASIGDGWLEYRENHGPSDFVPMNPPTIEIGILHFTGIQPAEPASGGGGGGGGSTSSISCFIATAAYGTPMADEVMVLRNFRDKYLVTNKPGQIFVSFYYFISPPLARLIAGSEPLRMAARATLTPIVYITRMAMESPGKLSGYATAIAGSSLLALMIFARKIRRKMPANSG